MHLATHQELLTRAGQYDFVFTSADGERASHQIYILPSDPVSIELVGNRVLVQDTFNTLTLVLRDRYGNSVAGDGGEITVEASDPVRLSSLGQDFALATSFTLPYNSGRIPLRILPKDTGNLRFTISIQQEGTPEFFYVSDHRVVDEIVLRLENSRHEFRVG